MPPKRRPSLGALVDDYFAKHYAAVEAGRVWRAQKCSCNSLHDPLLDAFTAAHNASAAAFRALRDSRKKK